MGVVAFLASKLSRNRAKAGTTGSVYDFRMKTLQGKEIDFSQYRGKKLMLVNTASKCGYTYQYADLQKIHEQHGDQVTILGFPANDFLWQEPGNNETIAEFCEVNYGVTFTLFEKIAVTGKQRHPLYQWLKDKTGYTPSWNFCKYLFDADGTFLGFYPAATKPMDPQILHQLGIKP